MLLQPSPLRLPGGGIAVGAGLPGLPLWACSRPVHASFTASRIRCVAAAWGLSDISRYRQALAGFL
jgi:hypothetical protein